MLLFSVITANIQIFDRCFSPKTTVVGNSLYFTISLNLLPFEELELLNPSQVRNMCKVVFFDAMATATLNFNVGPPLSRDFTYQYNQQQQIVFQLDQTAFNVYKVAQRVYFDITFQGQQSISFGVQSLRFLKKDYSNCLSNVNVQFSKNLYKYIYISVQPTNCDIDLNTAAIFLKSSSQKISIHKCTIFCRPDQYGSTTQFSSTLWYGQMLQLAPQAEQNDIMQMLNSLEQDLYQPLHIQIETQTDIISQSVSYVLISDERGCGETMTTIAYYNKNDIRTTLYGSKTNSFTCNLPTAKNIFYQIVFKADNKRQTYSMFEPYSVFQIRSSIRYVEKSILEFDPLKTELFYDVIFRMFDENNETVAQFSKHGVAFVGCIQNGQILKYSDKVCAKIDYVQSTYCSLRASQSETVTIKLYNEPNDDRTLRKWYGNFILPNQVVNYNINNTPQQFCVSCDQFDPTTAFTGSSCQNTLELFGGLLAKEAPKFWFKTSQEFTAFDYQAVSYEYISAMWPAAVIFGVLLVGVVVGVTFLSVKTV